MTPRQSGTPRGRAKGPRGFLAAVGVNIVLGQLSNFTGYDAEGANRVTRAIDTVMNPALLDPASV